MDHNANSSILHRAAGLLHPINVVRHHATSSLPNLSPSETAVGDQSDGADTEKRVHSLSSHAGTLADDKDRQRWVRTLPRTSLRIFLQICTPFLFYILG